MPNKVMHNNLSLRTWIEINQADLKHNYNIFRELINPDCKLMAVTKSNAYGHSLVDYSKAVQELGVDWIGVDSLVEAIKLRDNNIVCPILVLGYTFPDMIDRAIENNISLIFSSWPSLEALAEQNNINGLKIHLKFDTGMSRQGFFINEVDRVLDFVQKKLSQAELEGVCTHFAGAKNPAFPEFTKKQFENFKKVLDVFEQKGLKILRHAAATSGTIVFPESHLDMVRIAIGLFGLWPSKEVKYAFSDKTDLRPILTWKTVIGEVKTLPAGSKVGYDMTEEVQHETKIAVLPVGYWHGYDRSLSSLARVVIKGKRARVLGRVSMDMIIVDISNIPDIEIGDEVILIGCDNNTCFTADEMADIADTSNYEIVTRLNPLIKRVYI
ncbi:MAG: alanine racemase [bacterium]